MPSEIPPADPGRLWRGQPTDPPEENPIVIAQLLALHTRDLRARGRRKSFDAYTAPLAALGLAALAARQFAVPPGLWALFALAVAWSLAGIYFLQRGAAAPAAEGSGLETGLAACRGELERQRDRARGRLVWSFAPVLVAVAAFVGALALAAAPARSLFPQAAPFLSLLALWVVVYLVFRRWEQRDLQREIDEIDRIAREHTGV